MIDLRIGHHSLRLWFHEIPEHLKYHPVSTIQGEVEADPLHQYREACCIEMIMASGRAHYGLLGARFTPDTSQTYKVIVGVSEAQDEEVFLESMYRRLSRPPIVAEARIGLPYLEYAEGVIDGAYIGSGGLGAGTLEVVAASYSDLSSQKFFQLLSILLVQTIHFAYQHPGNKEPSILSSFMREAYSLALVIVNTR